MEIREIGLEKECFLIKDDKVMEPRLFGFPKDEFEFLVELRSLPSDRFYPVYTSIMSEELQYSLRANKFGMFLSDTPNRVVDKYWVDDLWKKHNLDRFKDCDYTKNIYPEMKDKPSHHFGRLPYSEYLYKLTSGIHVHFSSRDSESGEVIDLPIVDIVKRMDEEFKDAITKSERNLGEWEMKDHGFEYRSLPANADIYEVLKKSFEILRNV